MIRSGISDEVTLELDRQDHKWGEQAWPDGTGSMPFVHEARLARRACDNAAGAVTWRHILLEEVYEALAEENPEKLREELIQVAAVAQQWIEAIDRRTP